MKTDKNRGPKERCAYHSACYLADDLKCFGYKVDCILYRKSNGEMYDQSRFDQAMDKLIDATRKKFLTEASK